jgi:hypothetical protein
VGTSNALIDDSRISFSGDDIWINMSGLSLYDSNDSVTLSFTTSVVPLPAAVWLFGSGLLGLVGVARRKARI